jgi:hypothetical protein
MSRGANQHRADGADQTQALPLVLALTLSVVVVASRHGRALAVERHHPEGQLVRTERSAAVCGPYHSVQYRQYLLRLQLPQQMVQRGIWEPPGQAEALPGGWRQVLGQRLDLEQTPAARHQSEQRRAQQRAELPPAPPRVAWVVDLVQPGFAQPLAQGADDAACQSCVRHPDLLMLAPKARFGGC